MQMEVYTAFIWRECKALSEQVKQDQNNWGQLIKYTVLSGIYASNILPHSQVFLFLHFTSI